MSDRSLAETIGRTLLERAGWILRHGTAAALLATSVALVLPWTWESTAVLLPADRRTDDFNFRGAGSNAAQAGLRRLFSALRLQDRTHPQEIDQAILLGDTSKRILIERLDLTKQWRTKTIDDALTRLERALTLELVPYGPMLLRARTEDRDLSAELANEAALLLDERLDALRLESVRGERGFVTEAIRDELAAAADAGASLAAYDAGAGIADAKRDADEAARWAVDRTAALAAARLRRAEAARRYGAGSAEEADAAQEVETRRAAEARMPSAAAARTTRAPREDEVRRAERVAKLLGALRGQTWTSEAGDVGDVRILDAARPAKRPRLAPFAFAAALAFLVVPSAALAARFAPPGLVRPFLGKPSALLVLVAALLGLVFAREPGTLAIVLVAAFVVILVSDLRAAWLFLVLLVPWAWDFVDEVRGFAIQVPTEPGIIALVGAWAYAIALRGGVARPQSRILTAALLTVFWTAVASITSVYPKHSIFQTISVGGFVLAGAAFPIFEIRSLAPIRAVVLGTIVSCVVFSLYGIVQVFTSPIALDRAAFFIGAPFFDNHGPYGAYLGFGFGAAFVWAATRRPGERALPFLLALGIIGLATVVSLTRASWVALLALLAIAGVLRTRAFLRSALPALIALGIFVPVLLSTSGTTAVFDRYLERAVSADYGSNLERLNRWRVGVEMAIQRPITGVGPGAYPQAYGDFQDPTFANALSDRPMGPHMELLRAASEQGLPGLAIYVFLLVAIFGTARRLARSSSDPDVRRLALALGCGLFTLAVHGLFNEYVRNPEVTLVFWAFAGLLGALERIDSRRTA